MKNDLLKLFSLLLLIVGAPLLVDEGTLPTLVTLGTFAILAVALNLLLGFAGQISLGHAAFFGLGAYISGIFTTHFPFNPWLVMVVAALIVGLTAFVMGYPILKLKGHYLAMATLAFGIIFYIIFNEFIDWTGGPSGLPGIPSLSVGQFSFDSEMKNYYLIWCFALFTVLLSINISRSRVGRALRAIHDSEVAARVVGVNARLLKVQVFALSAAASSLAGSLYAHKMMFVSPSSFTFMFSVELVTMVIIGGMGSIYGPLMGAAILVLLPEWLRSFSDYDIIVFGSLLLFMIIFLPGGLVSLPQRAGQLLQRLRKEKKIDAPAQ